MLTCSAIMCVSPAPGSAQGQVVAGSTSAGRAGGGRGGEGEATYPGMTVWIVWCRGRGNRLGLGHGSPCGRPRHSDDELCMRLHCARRSLPHRLPRVRTQLPPHVLSRPLTPRMPGCPARRKKPLMSSSLLLCRTALRATRAPRASSSRCTVVVRAAVPPTPMGVRASGPPGRKALDSDWPCGAPTSCCRSPLGIVCFPLHLDTTHTHSLLLLPSHCCRRDCQLAMGGVLRLNRRAVGVCVQLPSPKRVPKNLQPRLFGACLSLTQRSPYLITASPDYPAAALPAPKHTANPRRAYVNVSWFRPASDALGACGSPNAASGGFYDRLLRPGRDHQQPRGHDWTLCTVRARGGTGPQPTLLQTAANPSRRRRRVLTCVCLLAQITNTGLLNIMGVDTGNGINIGF